MENRSSCFKCVGSKNVPLPNTFGMAMFYCMSKNCLMQGKAQPMIL